MTILVGILCTEGVVIGADSAATFGDGRLRTIEVEMGGKIFVSNKRLIAATTGEVGLAQRFERVVRDIETTEPKDTKLKRPSALSPTDAGKRIAAAAINDFIETRAQPGALGALVALVCDKKPTLIEFSGTHFQPELKTQRLWFASLGSGQPIVDPFLGLMRKIFFPNRLPSLGHGTMLATWALQHAIEVNPGGINGPICLATLVVKGGNAVATMLSQDEVDEHIQAVKAAEAHCATFLESGAPAGTPPALPAPPL